MSTVDELKARLFDEWLALEVVKSVVISPAGTAHDSATGKFTSKPGGGPSQGERDHMKRIVAAREAAKGPGVVSIAKVKAGDKIALYDFSRPKGNRWREAKVEKASPGQIIVEGKKFWRATGRAVGREEKAKFDIVAAFTPEQLLVE